MTLPFSSEKLRRTTIERLRAESDKPQRSAAEPGQITQLRSQVHSFEQAIAEKSREQEQIKQQIKLYQDRVQSSPVVEEQYKELTRGYQTALDSYNDLQKKRDESQMATELERQQEGEQFRVLDPANLPDQAEFSESSSFRRGRIGWWSRVRTRSGIPAGNAGYIDADGTRCRICSAITRAGNGS